MKQRRKRESSITNFRSILALAKAIWDDRKRLDELEKDSVELWKRQLRNAPDPPEPKPVDFGREVRFARDDTTPIPRPCRYYGRRQDLVTRDRAQLRKLGAPVSVDASLVPSAPDLLPARIDKSVLTIAEPKRIRDKAHLRFVASQPCLICGRQSSDPHVNGRIAAQPRGGAGA